MLDCPLDVASSRLGPSLGILSKRCSLALHITSSGCRAALQVRGAGLGGLSGLLSGQLGVVLSVFEVAISLGAGAGGGCIQAGWRRSIVQRASC
jgi:hypothetical protein